MWTKKYSRIETISDDAIQVVVRLTNGRETKEFTIPLTFSEDSTTDDLFAEIEAKTAIFLDAKNSVEGKILELKERLGIE